MVAGARLSQSPDKITTFWSPDWALLIAELTFLQISVKPWSREIPYYIRTCVFTLVTSSLCLSSVIY